MNLLTVSSLTVMNARQDLVEDWNQKLATASANSKSDCGQFGWVRQIYVRIYRFLTSRYGDGDWRSDAQSEDRSAQASTMDRTVQSPEAPSDFNGLQPKQPEQIREALKSIHENSPGIATAGATVSTDENMWVVVGAYKKASHARAIRKRLKYCGIEACLQHRAGDTAALVRRDDFHDATAIVERQITAGNRKVALTRTYSSESVTGSVLLFVTATTMLFVVFVVRERSFSIPWTWLGLWCAGLAAAWLCFGRRNEL